MTPVRWTLRSLAILLLIPLLTGCSLIQSGDSTYKIKDEDVLAQPREVNAGGLSYREPLEFQNGIGLRAVAVQNRLAISVLNRSNEPVVIGPKMVRIVLPDRTYAFEPERDDLRGFPILQIEPGESTVFSVQVSQLDELVDYGLVLNYPPRDILLRVFIEPAS